MQSPVHRAFVRDFQQTGTLFRVQIAIEGEAALEDIDLQLFAFQAGLTILGMALIMGQAQRDFLQRPALALGPEELNEVLLGRGPRLDLLVGGSLDLPGLTACGHLEWHG